MNEIILIDRQDIRDSYDSTIYRRGVNYYNEGRVMELNYDYKYQEWGAKVLGSSIYKVTVGIDEEGFLAWCSCPAHSTYGECKHEVAALVAISYVNNRNLAKNPQIIDMAEKRKYLQAERLINLFGQVDFQQSSPELNRTKQAIQVEFYLDSKKIYSLGTNLLSIEMRIGTKRVYVVKKIKELLHNLENNRHFYFTNNYTYDPTEQYFSQEDQEVINILQNIAEHETLNQKISSSWTQVTDSREILILPYAVEDLLEKLKQTNVRLLFSAPIGADYQIVDGDKLPISYSLTAGGRDDYELAIKGLSEGALFYNYKLLFLHGVFYKLSTNQLGLIAELLAFCKESGSQKILIAKPQLEQVLAQVEPKLRKVGQLTIAESIADQIISLPLLTKIYIDYNQEQLLVKIEHHYGSRIINPLQNEQNSDNSVSILIRDLEKEQEIMKILESTSLKYNGKQLYMTEEQEIYSFIFNIAPLLEDKAEIFLTGAAKSLIVQESSRPSFSVDIDSDTNWLEFSFNMEGIEQQDVQKILQSVIEKKRYYRLPNGSFVSLESDEFSTISRLFGELRIDKRELTQDKIKREVNRGILVEDFAKQDSTNILKLSKSFKKFIRNFQNPEQLDFQLPKGINANLRDYQLEGFQWLKTLSYYGLGGILADDMGLGKTLQAIAYIVSEIEEKKATKPFLIVAPASLTYNWKNEFYKFAPELKIKVIDGTPEERIKLIKEAHKAGTEALITSYPLLRQDKSTHLFFRYSALILDEAQAIKNPETKTFKATALVQADKHFALSGTPIENSIDELWSIFQVINSGFFPSKNKFRENPPEKIAQLVRPFILRRIKKDVLKELPDKIETIHVSELNKEQKELYLAYLERIRSDSLSAIQQEGFNKSRIKILAGLTRLRQICNHPALFVENYQGGSGKLDYLMELITESQVNKNRLLIFSQFASMLQIIKDRLEQREISYFHLDGQTPGIERVEMADRYNHGERDIFLISLKAGGTGLNLTGADTVILFDLWWNPAVEEQAAGRAHRIGQKKVVQVIRLITQGSIEEKIYELQQKKKELIAQIIDSDEAMLGSLSEDDLREILGIESRSIGNY